MRVLACSVAIAALLPHAHAVHAQRAQPETVPLEFVELLAMMPMMGGRPEVAVGRLPERLTSELSTLPDMRVVGSMIGPLFSTSAVALPGEPAQVRQRVIARLVEAGWTVRSSRPQPPSGGFEIAPRASSEPGALCAPDNHNLQLTTSRHRGDSTAVVLFLGRGEFGSSCRDPDIAQMPYPESPLPTLVAPAGSQHLGGGYGGGGGPMDSNAHARLRTEMTPATLLDHYAAQMTAQGWLPVTQSKTDSVAIQVFRMTDAEQVPWHGVLYVTLLPNGERDLYLRMSRIR